MPTAASIVGVHEIEADELVHLIEIEFASDADEFDFGEVTQALPNVDRDYWQSAYDEREIDSTSGKRRFAFFFHYLDVSLPLITSFGEIQIPASTPIPERLRTIEYEAP